MISISSRSRFAAAVSPLALAVTLAATPAWAQDTQSAATDSTTTTAVADQPQAPPSDTAANAENSDQKAKSAIIVTGFRASLRSATAK